MTEKELAEIIGENISGRRRKLGLTQAQLAEKLDIGQDALSRMENGAISPKIARLRDIAAALQCSVADLFREPDEGADERAGGYSRTASTTSTRKPGVCFKDCIGNGITNDQKSGQVNQ